MYSFHFTKLDICFNIFPRCWFCASKNYDIIFWTSKYITFSTTVFKYFNIFPIFLKCFFKIFYLKIGCLRGGEGGVPGGVSRGGFQGEFWDKSQQIFSKKYIKKSRYFWNVETNYWNILENVNTLWDFFLITKIRFSFLSIEKILFEKVFFMMFHYLWFDSKALVPRFFIRSSVSCIDR